MKKAKANTPPPPPRSEFTFTCQSCNQKISASPSVAGTKQGCPTCGEVVDVPKLKSSSKIDPESLSFFAWVEATLLKMIIGIPRFIFWVIPREIFRIINRLFPWLVRLVRVAILTMIWLSIVIWPLFLKSSFRELIMNLFGSNDPVTFDVNYGWFDPASYIWIGLAFSGSIWGAIYVVLKKSKKKKQAKTDHVEQDAALKQQE